MILTLGISTAMILFAQGFLAPYGTVQGQFALAGVVGILGAALLWLKSGLGLRAFPGWLQPMSWRGPILQRLFRRGLSD